MSKQTSSSSVLTGRFHPSSFVEVPRNEPLKPRSILQKLTELRLQWGWHFALRPRPPLNLTRLQNISLQPLSNEKGRCIDESVLKAAKHFKNMLHTRAPKRLLALNQPRFARCRALSASSHNAESILLEGFLRKESSWRWDTESKVSILECPQKGKFYSTHVKHFARESVYDFPFSVVERPAFIQDCQIVIKNNW